MKKPNKREVVFWIVILGILWLLFFGCGIGVCLSSSLHWAWSIVIAFGGVIFACIVAAAGIGIVKLIGKFAEWALDD